MFITFLDFFDGNDLHHPVEIEKHFVITHAEPNFLIFNGLLTPNSRSREIPSAANTFRPSHHLLPNYVETRSTYSPVSVEILTLSPSRMKAGTWISAPVSTVAALVTLVAVLPRAAGSV